MTVGKEYFGQAADEVASGKIDRNLYIKACAMTDGDEARGRAVYIRLRAEELAKEAALSGNFGAAAEAFGGVAGVAVGAASAALAVERKNRVAYRTLMFFASVIPGLGHLLGRRPGVAAGFFILWVLAWLAGAAFDNTARSAPYQTASDFEVLSVICFTAVALVPLIAAIHAAVRGPATPPQVDVKPIGFPQ